MFSAGMSTGGGRCQDAAYAMRYSALHTMIEDCHESRSVTYTAVHR
jgi:hypothetical protein